MSEIVPQPGLTGIPLDPLTPAERKKALQIIRRKGRTIGDALALRTAGVAGSTGQLRQLIKADPDLQEEIAEARGRSQETIRGEVKRRAVDGIERPIYQAGKLVGHETVYSDKLLEMMAKAHLPEYREVAKLELTGAGGGALEVTVEHDYGRLLDKLEQVGVLRRGPVAALDAPPVEVLPARTD